MLYLGRLPQYDPVGSNWREIRILRDYAVIGSEAIHHGVQIFDMKKLLTLDPANPTNFTQDEITGHWDELPIGRTHNIVVNQELNYAIAAGSVGGNETIRVRGNLPCRGGLIFLNMTDPANPWSPGCAAGDGYVHDAECLVYRGPDKRYEGRDICYGYNEVCSYLLTLVGLKDTDSSPGHHHYLRCYQQSRKHYEHYLHHHLSRR